MKMIAVGLLALSASAAWGQVPNQSEVSLEEATYNGPGCPIGSVAFNMSQDRLSLTALFDQFTASTTPAQQVARAACSLDLKLRVPQGWSYALYNSQIRGFVSLDGATKGKQQAIYTFGAQRLLISEKSFEGPLSEDYLAVATPPLAQVVWSPCGGMRFLTVTASLDVRGPNGLLTVDSVDGSLEHVYGLSWRRCNGTEIIGPSPLQPSNSTFIRVLDGFTGRDLFHLNPFPFFAGNGRVAVGDINGDRQPDVIAGAGPSMSPRVGVFDGNSGEPIAHPLRSFFAFDVNFRGGVSVGAGDVDGDGRDDLIVGAGPGGGPHVKVFSGASGSEIRSFFAYDTHLRTGINVAAADINGDGRADIITAPMHGGAPHVKVFDGATQQVIRSFYSYDSTFSGGVTVAGGDVNRDGLADIITGAGRDGGPHVKVFSGRTQQELMSFHAFDPNFRGGVYVASTDLDRDGFADVLVGAGAGGGPHVRVISGATGLGFESWQGSFFSFAPNHSGGSQVAAMPPRANRFDPRTLLVVMPGGF